MISLSRKKQFIMSSKKFTLFKTFAHLYGSLITYIFEKVKPQRIKLGEKGDTILMYISIQTVKHSR